MVSAGPVITVDAPATELYVTVAESLTAVVLSALTLAILVTAKSDVDG
jgi:hypothetical protein